ncbi:MAG: hypothetical protein OEZ68_03935 [Gammaproteobacteria bacterium]|nr:hypothetical protein [Gammaproteobacteria bacterium]MDH5799936.1 hypothetical protein [Gammaproteobacteria bacterium]
MKPLFDQTGYTAINRNIAYNVEPESWPLCWNHLKRALALQTPHSRNNANTYTELEQQIQRFYAQLQQTPEFTENVRAINTSPRNNNPWLGQELFNDGHMEVSLNVYFNEAVTPIHDRSRRVEAFIVLSGQARVQHFSILPSPIESHYPIVKLRRDECENLERHQLCLLHSGFNSVHEITALSGRCVVLRLSIYDVTARTLPCWYFPISSQHNEEFFTQRVKQF